MSENTILQHEEGLIVDRKYLLEDLEKMIQTGRIVTGPGGKNSVNQRRREGHFCTSRIICGTPLNKETIKTLVDMLPEAE